MDLAGALGIEHSQPLEDRKLIFIGNGEKLAFGVDKVWDPEELPLEQIKPIGAKSGGDPSVFESIIGNGRGSVPILKADFFFPLSTLSQRAQSLKRGEGVLAREVKRG